MADNIIKLDGAARLVTPANRVGGITHETPAAHQPEPNLGRSAPAFVKMNKQQMRQDNYLARTGMYWIVLAVSWLLAGLILVFGPGLITKAAAAISF